MDHDSHQNNSLVLYRRRMKFSQRFVSRLLGHADTSMLSRYEHGRSLPPLATGLRLEIIYRVPVAFLFPSLYEELRNQIRSDEARSSGLHEHQLLHRLATGEPAYPQPE